MTNWPEADLYEILEPIILRPAMYFGTKSITAFGHYYHGLIHLGGAGHCNPTVFKMRNEIGVFGFTEWMKAKHGIQGRPTGAWSDYLVVAARKLKEDGVDEPSELQKEALGFDLFVEDYKEFKEIPRNFDWWDFMARLDELKKEPEQGCLVYRCDECGHEGCWYEGLLIYLFKRLNEPCHKCGGKRSLHNGVGEEYEL